MANNLAKLILLIFSTFFVLSACVGGDAYIYKYKEFDRDNPSFAKTIKNRSIVEICYNRQSITSQDLTKLAQNECKRLAKNAIFVGHQILKCSVASPAVATFKCISEK